MNKNGLGTYFLVVLNRFYENKRRSKSRWNYNEVQQLQVVAYAASRRSECCAVESALRNSLPTREIQVRSAEPRGAGGAESGSHSCAIEKANVFRRRDHFRKRVNCAKVNEEVGVSYQDATYIFFPLIKALYQVKFSCKSALRSRRYSNWIS